MKADTVVKIMDMLVMLMFSALWTLMLLGAFNELVARKIEVTIATYTFFCVLRIYYLVKRLWEERQ